MSRTLHCENGDHDWTQESWGRGRPPKNCQKHKDSKPTEKPQDEPKENPFIKKAKVNPFIEKLAEDLEAGTGTASEDEDILTKAQTKCERCNNNERMEGESICFDCMEAETNPDAEAEVETETHTAAPEPVQEPVKPPKNKPATFKRIDHDEIVDDNVYSDISLPGVKIHNVGRDLSGFWKCKVTVNEETLQLIRRGGWLIQLEDGKMRAVKPNVAAVIAEIVAKLQPKPEPDEKKKAKRDQKTLEQVADDVVPFEEGHEDKVDKRRRRTEIVEEEDTQAAQSIITDAMTNDPYAEGGEMHEAHKNNLEALNDEDDEFDDMAAAFSALDF